MRNNIRGPLMPTKRSRFPRSAILLIFCGFGLMVPSAIRLKGIPLGRHLSTKGLWQRDAKSVVIFRIGFVCILLAAWLANAEKNIDDTNDPLDDPIARLDQSDPITRPPASDK